MGVSEVVEDGKNGVLFNPADVGIGKEHCISAVTRVHYDKYGCIGEKVAEEIFNLKYSTAIFEEFEALC